MVVGREVQTMCVVHVYLEDGFDRDSIMITAGSERVSQRDVTTRYQIGLAAVVELTVPDDGPVTVAVAVVSRDLTAEATVDPAVTPHLCASIEDGSLVLRADATPPMFA